MEHCKIILTLLQNGLPFIIIRKKSCKLEMFSGKGFCFGRLRIYGRISHTRFKLAETLLHAFNIRCDVKSSHKKKIGTGLNVKKKPAEQSQQAISTKLTLL